jgi:hypothetical protein
VPLEFGNIADYVLNPVQCSLSYYGEDIPHVEPEIVYSQFVSTTKESIENTVHANQVIIVESKNLKQDNIIIGAKNSTFEQSMYDIVHAINPNTGISTLMPDVVWIAMNRFGDLFVPTEEHPLPDDVIAEMTGNQKLYYIGINRQPIYEGNQNYCEYYVISNDGTKIWLREMFIPYLYKLEHFGEITQMDAIMKNLTQEEIFKRKLDKDTYTINKTDVVCFLPELHCVRRPSEFMWKYICQTTNEEITPLTFRPKTESAFPTILQPLFGRYDFNILPSAGYYDIIFNYKLDDNQTENLTKTVASQFIVSKN